MNQNNNNGALSDIKVIDLTRVLSGPFCTMLLADMGAEVIKIEPPKGDNVRNQGDMIDGYSSYFAQFNRNKKSVILDLYKETDKDGKKTGTEEEYLGVDNGAMTYMLINAVKEQQVQIENMTKMIEQLQSEIEVLKKK